MSDIFEEPPDDNEAYESLDESLDAEDALGDGPEGERELDRDLVVDQEELAELGADLDDPERLSVLEGAMDDPDGSGPYDIADDKPTDGATSAERDMEVTEIEPWEMDEVADDTPKGDAPEGPRRHLLLDGQDTRQRHQLVPEAVDVGGRPARLLRLALSRSPRPTAPTTSRRRRG